MKTKNISEEKVRESGIELLRILLMYMIVMHHFIIHGCHLQSIEKFSDNFGTYQLLFYESFLLFPVNCFVFISGFYRISFKSEKIILMIFQSLFYAVTISLIFILTSITHYSISGYIRGWWFIFVYIFIILLSPALNHLAETLSKSKFEFLIITGLLINQVASFFSGSVILGGDGSTLLNLMFIYLIARYFSIYKPIIHIKKINFLILFFVCCLIVAILSLFLFKYNSGKGIWILYRFNNPLLLLESICIFYIFKELKFKSKLVNRISSMVLAVYMISDYHLVRKYIYDKIFRVYNYSSEFNFIIYLILFSLIVFIIGICIEKMRIFIMTPLTNKVVNMKIIDFINTKILK